LERVSTAKFLDLRFYIFKANELFFYRYESLSPGEIQRLCFLRVFFHHPLVAILDESTSALPTAMEETIFRECKRLGITTISAAHRESVRQYHKKLLTLEVGGAWSLTDI